MLDLLYVLLSAVVFGLDQAGKRESRKKYRKRYLIVSNGKTPIESDDRRRGASALPKTGLAGSARSGGSADSGKTDKEDCPCGHLVAVRYLENRGAMLNFGDSHSLVVRLISIGLTVVLTLVYILTLGHAGKNLLKAGLSLLLGGAFSNTYDRLKDGYVTDYLSFRFGPKALRNIVFNIGDFAIMIGALLVVLGS